MYLDVAYLMISCLSSLDNSDFLLEKISHNMTNLAPAVEEKSDNQSVIHKIHNRGKKILKFSLVPRARKVKCLLVLLPNNLSEIYCKINLHWIFHLSAEHWVKIFACPAWNFTCTGLQDKWFFYPCTIYILLYDRENISLKKINNRISII